MDTFSNEEYDVSQDYLKSQKNILDGVDLYFDEIRKIPLLTREEEYDLLVKAKNGDNSARNKLMESNLKLVVYVAKRNLAFGIPFQDLLQEGNLGLKKAIDGYDLKSNNRFATYAIWWIKQSISRAIEINSRIIRIPSYLNDKLAIYQRKKEQLEFEKCRTLSTYELSLALNISLKEVENYERLLQDPISYDITLKSEEDSKTELSLFLKSNENVEESVINGTLKEELNKCIANTNLTMNETYVLIKRYGLDGNEPMTLEQVAQLLSINKQRANQIELKALKKLNNDMSKKRLYPFLYPYDDVDFIEEKERVLVYDESLEGLSDDLKKFFVDKDLTLEEVRVLSLSDGLIDGNELSNQEIADKLNISLDMVRRYKKIAYNKINEHQKLLRKK